ncbi:hypothetical protein [Oceanobacter mangrovi]|uniref:hypothetical protein n=1 Tax=Oceanobacter mangrovi TaxID=2862510 RepID=UPI001C8DA3F4|nr:hypothetical protein [Oceanobacter mangrovi]
MEAVQRLGSLYSPAPAEKKNRKKGAAQWQFRLVDTSGETDSGDDLEGDSRGQVLAEKLMPMAVHMVNYYRLPLAQTLNFVYIDSTRSLGEYASALLGVLRNMSGKNEAWVPLVGSHSLLLNALRLIASELKLLDLTHTPLLYIGDFANFAGVRELGDSCSMPVFCQATY